MADSMGSRTMPRDSSIQPGAVSCAVSFVRISARAAERSAARAAFTSGAATASFTTTERTAKTPPAKIRPKAAPEALLIVL